MRYLFSVRMASQEWDDWQELTEFKQLPNKTRFKHPVKEEKILELFKGFVPMNTKKIYDVGIQSLLGLANRKK